MSDFNVAVQLTLKHEGGYEANPSDPGGPTNMGVTQNDMPGTDIRDLTITQAETFYKAHFWYPLYSSIADQNIASKLFDMGVLFGARVAVEILQEVLRNHYSVEVDGYFGDQTLQAVNASDSASLLLAYRTAMVARAVAIGANRPAERIFVAGWINRINS